MIIKTAEDFGKLVQATRKDQQLTQNDVAAATGTGVRFVRELEKGKPSCQLEKSLLIARLLGIKFEALLPPLARKN